MTLTYEEIGALLRGLTDELNLVGGIQGGGTAQRRLLVRTLFSILEAQAFVLKQHVLESHRHGKVALSEKEHDRLRDVRKKAQPGGTVSEEKSFLPVKDNLKLAIVTYARARMTTAFDLQLFEPEFSAGLGVRHRITHPKHPADLGISGDESKALARVTEMVKALAQWQTDTELAFIDRIKKEIHDSTERQIAEMRAAIQPPPKRP